MKIKKYFCSSYRRSVSNLLRSSFRESLDQLIQSYVERQGHANAEWELQETAPSSASVEQDLEQHNRDQLVGQEDPVNSSLDLPLSPTPSQTFWNQNDNWPQNDMNNQRLGIVRSFFWVFAELNFVSYIYLKVKIGPYMITYPFCLL